MPQPTPPASCLRRTLKKLGIDKTFPGVKDTTGDYVVPRIKGDDESTDRFPFKAILDVGLARTTTGARIFGVLKGAVDGGIAVPHKPNRFPGFNKEKQTLDAKKHRERIFGGHVSSYMKKITAEKVANPDEKINQFSAMEKAGVKPEQLEKLYKDAHAAIRADPTKKIAKKPSPPGAKSKNYSKPKLSRKEKRVIAKKKVEALRARVAKAKAK